MHIKLTNRQLRDTGGTGEGAGPRGRGRFIQVYPPQPSRHELSTHTRPVPVCIKKGVSKPCWLIRLSNNEQQTEKENYKALFPSSVLCRCRAAPAEADSCAHPAPCAADTALQGAESTTKPRGPLLPEPQPAAGGCTGLSGSEEVIGAHTWPTWISTLTVLGSIQN